MSVVLPESFLKCVAPADRAKLRAGMTASEFLAAGAAKNERELQKQIVALLRLKGIEAFSQRMDKRTRGKVGQPDFIFAVNGQAVAWEVKTPMGKLSVEQERMAIRLMRDGWHWRVIRSVDEARAELTEMGVE